MKLKKAVSISLIVSSAILALILLIGLLVPASFLNKIGRKTKPDTQIETIVDGKKVVETVNPATGEKTVTTTDPTTGQTTVTTTNPTTGQTTTQAVTNGQTSASQPTNTPTTGGTSNTGGTSATPAPVVTISVSPSSITSGSSATLGWSATNSPTSCSASNGWSGTKAASGTASVNPTSSATYTLSCSNSGGSNSKSATLTVNAPAATCGQPGGTCHLSDIQGHSSSGDCRSAINSTGGGLAAYSISSSFLSLHNPKKSITSLLCGNVYSSNLRNKTGDHSNGSTLGGGNYATWMNNLYLGPYN